MEDKRVSRREFAKEINKSHTWVGDKIREGYITLQDGKIPMSKALEEIKGHGLLSKEEDKTAEFPKILQSKERYEFYRAEKIEIELGILRKEIIKKEDLIELYQDISQIAKYATNANALYVDGIHEANEEWISKHEGKYPNDENGTDDYEEMDEYFKYVDGNAKVRESIKIQAEILSILERAKGKIYL